jgi:hypothetical protein
MHFFLLGGGTNVLVVLCSVLALMLQSSVARATTMAGAPPLKDVAKAHGTFVGIWIAGCLMNVTEALT